MIPFTFAVTSDVGISMYFGTSFKDAEEVFSKCKCSARFYERDSTGKVKRLINEKYRPACATIKTLMDIKK